jgi:hypothetical protein
MRPVSGGGLEGDGAAHGLELADVVALLPFGVDVGVVPVGAEVANRAGRLASRCQTMIRMDRPTATIAYSCRVVVRSAGSVPQERVGPPAEAAIYPPAAWPDHQALIAATISSGASSWM